MESIGQNYITVENRLITVNPVDLATNHIKGNLPVTHLNSGTDASSTTYWRGDGVWATPGGGGGGGTVTSVGISGSNGIGVSGSPVTGSGTIALSLGNITPTSVDASGNVTGANLALNYLILKDSNNVQWKLTVGIDGSLDTELA